MIHRLRCRAQLVGLHALNVAVERLARVYEPLAWTQMFVGHVLVLEMDRLRSELQQGS